jgi:hypothetical protein
MSDGETYEVVDESDSSGAGDHLREAASHVNDSQGGLMHARNATDDGEVQEMIEKAEEVAYDLEDTLYDIAEKADAAAEEADDA